MNRFRFFKGSGYRFASSDMVRIKRVCHTSGTIIIVEQKHLKSTLRAVFGSALTIAAFLWVIVAAFSIGRVFIYYSWFPKLFHLHLQFTFRIYI